MLLQFKIEMREVQFESVCVNYNAHVIVIKYDFNDNIQDEPNFL